MMNPRREKRPDQRDCDNLLNELNMFHNRRPFQYNRQYSVRDPETAERETPRFTGRSAFAEGL